MNPLEVLLEQIVDFREHLNLHVLIADLLDHPLSHLGVGLQQALFKIVEAVRLPGEVVDQAGDPARTTIVARHHKERGQADLLGKITLLQRLRFEAGEVEGPQQGFIGDHTLFAYIRGKQRLARAQINQFFIFIQTLDFPILAIRGENLQALTFLFSTDARRHQHRCQRKFIDQTHR